MTGIIGDVAIPSSFRRGVPADAAVDLPGDDAVLRTLLARRAAGTRADGHRVAVVVSGGGMRGAYAGGMAHALEDAGLGGWIDTFYGSSAGAYIAAALLLGDGRGSARIFHEDMASRAFIDPRRFGTRRPMVSLDHLLDVIMAGDARANPMPWERLVGAPLHVVATAADDLTAHVLTPTTAQEWKRALRATAAIPLLAGPPVELQGRLWIDGSVSDPLPVLRALTDGATHVLALLTRTVPQLLRADPAEGPTRWARSLDRIAPGLGALAQEGPRLAPALALVGDAGHPARVGRHVHAVAPRTGTGVHGLSTDVAAVRRASELGYRTMTEHLERVAAGGVAGGGITAG